MSALVRLWRTALAHKATLLTCLVGAVLFFGSIGMLWLATLKIPDLASLQNRKVEQSLKIYDRTGTVVLYDLNRDITRTVVPLSEISPNIQNATIAIEDPEFYSHHGIRPLAILRAVLADLIPGGVTQGGSTLTQQVVKLSVLTTDKSITRKLKEWVLALKLERVLTKNQILELYLNQAPYGGSVYGAQEASERFFGVPASAVTLPEAAYLAAILPAPTYYSPYGSHKDALDARKNLVLDKMYEHGYITEKERDDAKAAQVIFQTPRTTSILAPHFVFYVEQYLEDKYGQDALEQSGWKVITTLDADLQTKAEEVIQKNAPGNETNFNDKNMGLIAIDPRNGQILSMVGSRNYFDKEIDGNFNVTTAPRQPGSAFKPFAYAQAFEDGYTPDTVLFDVPTQFSTQCDPNDLTNDTPPCYSPGNYDDKFRGPMTLRDAIAQSINVPSVEVLYLAGISDTLKLAKSMGVSTLGSPNQYGLTLVLGGGEVTLLEMTSAYGAFAQNGVHYPTSAVLRIEDMNGNIIEDNSMPSGNQVLPAGVAEEINDILSDPVARAPLGENTLFTFAGHDVAVKTGTTNNYRDAWTIGYTPNIAIGIWAGNNDNTSMVKKVSGFIVGPTWHEVMAYALSKTTPTPFSRADTSTAGMKPVLSGIWQGGQLQQQGGITSVVCDVHSALWWLNKNDPQGAVPGASSNDPQFPYWEAAVRSWAAQHGCAPGSLVPVSYTDPQSNQTTNFAL